MPAKSIKVEQLKLILTLHQKGYSKKKISRQTGLALNTVKKYLRDPVESDANDAVPPVRTQKQISLYDHFAYAEGELKRTGVTRQMLWIEYKELNPDGYNYSQYCYHFNEFVRHKEVVMHLDHKAGESIMIDFAGKKLCYVNPVSGELIPCQTFVSVLPHSGLIWCRAVATQNTLDFVDCINGMLKYYGGVTETIVCDNLKTAVIRPNRYEPVFTEVCYQLSAHYSSCFTAARPYKPRDKAMVERSVSIIYTHVYAPLRNQIFHSLQELNEAIWECVEKLNSRPYKGSAYSRRDLFNQFEKQCLKALPCEVFQHKKVVQATVQRNYHIQLSENHHYYSVPYMYVGKKVKVLYDNSTVEIYYEQSRIAIHQRKYVGSAYHTLGDHMPVHHQKAKQFNGWSEEELLQKANRVGSNARQVATRILSSSIYPQQNFKACHGMILLQNKYGVLRLEAACERTLKGSRTNYTMIRTILEKGLDKQTDFLDVPSLPVHDNIRGPGQYQ
jgi:transposase